jgi:peptidyl-prolyl cis-trans isomerase SurA
MHGVFIAMAGAGWEVRMRFFTKFGVITVCIIAAGLVAFPAAQAETVDRIVANVNGEIILYSELEAQIKIMGKMSSGLDLSDPAKKSQVEHDILDQLILQKLAESEAERLKVTASTTEVENILTRMMEDNHMNMAQLQASLNASGQTVEKLRDRIKQDLIRSRLMERVLKDKVTISDQQVDEYLHGAAGEAATTTEKIRLALIILPTAKYGKPEEAQKTGREISAKLKEGADFGTMARQYSKGNTAQDGGDIGYMAREEIAPFIAQAIKDLRKGETSGLVQGPGGYYIAKVLDIDTKRMDPSDPNLRERVRKYLYEREVNHRFEEWARGLESKAFIQITL